MSEATNKDKQLFTDGISIVKNDEDIGSRNTGLIRYERDNSIDKERRVLHKDLSKKREVIEFESKMEKDNEKKDINDIDTIFEKLYGSSIKKTDKTKQRKSKEESFNLKDFGANESETNSAIDSYDSDKIYPPQERPTNLERYYVKDMNKKCYKCKRKGHSIENCVLSIVRCDYCLESHLKRNCKRVTSCFICSDEDHVKSSCRVKRNDICRRCGKAYHQAKNCSYLTPFKERIEESEFRSLVCMICNEKGHLNCGGYDIKKSLNDGLYKQFEEKDSYRKANKQYNKRQFDNEVLKKRSYINRKRNRTKGDDRKNWWRRETSKKDDKYKRDRQTRFKNNYKAKRSVNNQSKKKAGAYFHRSKSQSGIKKTNYVKNHSKKRVKRF